MENFKFRAYDKGKKEWLLYYKELGGFSLFGETVVEGMFGSIWSKHLANDSLGDLVVNQFTGLRDSLGTDIYADDIIEDEGGRQYRVYSLRGGFGIKASPWSKDFNDLLGPDTLIIEPLADAQTRSYVTTTCKVVGNIYDNEVI